MNKLYPKKILQKALEDANLPHSYPTLLRYEKKGLVKRPKGEIHYTDRSWRLYSEEEIAEIVEIIKKHNER